MTFPKENKEKEHKFDCVCVRDRKTFPGLPNYDLWSYLGNNLVALKSCICNGTGQRNKSELIHEFGGNCPSCGRMPGKISNTGSLIATKQFKTGLSKVCIDGVWTNPGKGELLELFCTSCGFQGYAYPVSEDLGETDVTR